MLVNVFPYDVHPSRAANRAFEEYLRRDSTICSSVGAAASETRPSRSGRSPMSHPLMGCTNSPSRRTPAWSSWAPRTPAAPDGAARQHRRTTPPRIALPGGGGAEGLCAALSDELAVIGCGYDASLSAAHALETAHRLAVATGARLRVIRVFTPLAFDTPPDSVLMGGMASYNDTLHERATRELESAIATIDAEPGVEAEFTVGDPGKLLAEASEQLDLLVVGSRGYGPMHAVMVGGVAGRLVREAACPVIVVPRGAGHTEADSLFAKTAVATHA